MNKNIRNIMLITALSLTMITGCSKAELAVGTDETPKTGDVVTENDSDDGVTPVEDSNTDQKPVQGITVNKIQFTTVDVTTLSEQLQGEIEALKLQKGYAFWQQEDGSYLIMVSAGEKTTGGYGIEVTSIEDNEGKTVIAVNETSAEGDMATEVMTYPYVLVQASGITDQFVVRDQNQEEYKQISAEDIGSSNASGDLNDSVLRIDPSVIDYSKPVAAVYKGMLDDQTMEVTVEDKDMTFSADNMAKLLEGIEAGDHIEITVSISPSDQLIVENVVKVK